jgi:hypothetical protein
MYCQFRKCAQDCPKMIFVVEIVITKEWWRCRCLFRCLCLIFSWVFGQHCPSPCVIRSYWYSQLYRIYVSNNNLNISSNCYVSLVYIVSSLYLFYYVFEEIYPFLSKFILSLEIRMAPVAAHSSCTITLPQNTVFFHILLYIHVWLCLIDHYTYNVTSNI